MQLGSRQVQHPTCRDSVPGSGLSQLSQKSKWPGKPSRKHQNSIPSVLLIILALRTYQFYQPFVKLVFWKQMYLCSCRLFFELTICFKMLFNFLKKQKKKGRRGCYELISFLITTETTIFWRKLAFVSSLV